MEDPWCFPVGMRFHPTEEELISHYLYLKNNPNSATPSLLVPECDLYGDEEPWSIWEANGGPNLIDQDLFFFTRHKKKVNGSRILRRVGSSGTWSQGEQPKPVFDRKGTKIGTKTKLRYENKLASEHGCWILEEYSNLADHNDFVICRLRENRSSAVAVRKNDNELPKKKRKTVSLNHEEDSCDDQLQLAHFEDKESNDVMCSAQHQVVQIEDTEWLDVALQANSWGEDTYKVQGTESEMQQPNEAQGSTGDEEFNFAFDVPMDHDSDEFSDYCFGDEFLLGGVIPSTIW